MAFLPPRRLPVPLRLLAFFSVPAFLLAAGTVGYRLTEGWSWFDCFYVAVITLTSIGYGDKYAFTVPGKVLTLVLALGGISTFALAATELLGTIITGELHDFWDKRRMRKRIAALDRHVIVCGHGHVGRHVCADLLGGGAGVVVIDRREEALPPARDGGARRLLGDASADAVLRAAGIERARALIAVAGSDADNVLITMTARLLCPELPIIACAEEDAAVPKLQRAGATRTVSPHALAGGRLAEAVLRPSVLDLIQSAADRRPDLQIEEQLVQPGSPLDGQTVGTSGLRSWRGLIVLAIKRRDGRLVFNPGDDAPVAAGDTLITVGQRERVGRVDEPALSR